MLTSWPKVLGLFFLFLVNLEANVLSNSEDKVTVKWFGTTCISISDNDTSLMFDPYLTAVSLWDLIFFRKISSDKQAVSSILKSVNVPVKAVFVSHNHFDHVLDLAEVMKQSKSQLFATSSTHYIAKAGGIESKKLSTLTLNEAINVGRFKITALKSSHPAHFLGFTLASADIQGSFKYPAPLAHYTSSDVLSFIIEHPKGTILFHPSPSMDIDLSMIQNRPIDLFIQGIGNLHQSKEYVKKMIYPVKPRFIIPTHYDSLFKDLSQAPTKSFISNLGDFTKAVKDLLPLSSIVKLNYGQPFLFDIERK